MIRFGIIGYGYWGPNIVRNLHGIDSTKVVAICDQNETALRRAKQSFPGVRLTTDASELMSATDIDAIAVITPVWTHFELAKSALMNGKHVFVEKPFTSTSAQAEELIDLAVQKNLQIMVDHTFLFTGAVKKIRQLIDDNTLGKLYYYDSTRVNLGLFQHDVNVLWDLAPHDLSIMDYLIGERPEAIVATGREAPERADRCGLHHGLFPGQHHRAHQRQLAFSGQGPHHADRRRKENGSVERPGGGREDQGLRPGVQMNSREGVYNLLVSYRSGDMWSPKIEAVEALKAELAYFVDCIHSGEPPMNDGLAGLRIVRMLEAAEESLKRKGEAVYA